MFVVLVASRGVQQSKPEICREYFVRNCVCLCSAHSLCAMSTWEDALIVGAEPVPAMNQVLQFGVSDRDTASRILSVAMLLGEADMIWDDAVQIYRHLKKKHVEAGTWEQVCQEYRRRRDLHAAGSMTDGSKRLRSQSTGPGSPAPTTSRQAPIYGDETPSRTSSRGSLSAQPGSGGPPPPTSASSAPRGPPPPTPVLPRRDQGYASPTPATGPMTAPPRVVTSSASNRGRGRGRDDAAVRPAPMRRMVPGTTVEIPEDMEDFDQWGQNVVTFGKFAKRAPTYEELADLNTKEAVSYKKWIMEHNSTGGSKLMDLASYLLACKELDFLPIEAPSSPTTSTASFTRVLRTP